MEKTDNLWKIKVRKCALPGAGFETSCIEPGEDQSYCQEYALVAAKGKDKYKLKTIPFLKNSIIYSESVPALFKTAEKAKQAMEEAIRARIIKEKTENFEYFFDPDQVTSEGE